MQQISKITDDPLQIQTLILPDGTSFTIQMHYSGSQNGWFIDSLTYSNFTLDGLRICNSPNILRQWIHIIPFGLACTTQGNREPMFVQDFLDGISNLYILTHDEALQYEAYLSAR